MPSFYKPILFCALFVIVFVCSKLVSTNANTLLSTRVADPSILKSHCSNIDLQIDQCAFVKKSCHGFSALYLEFYYCSTLWKPLIIGALLSGLLLLFGAISVVASDFFCPNLQTIASKLELSESLAGVTVLAFGNGSPDLFGTFSAMDSGSGSMAIGEIIGAAFFIVSVITGCMGIIRPFQSKRITFMRDASFLTGAVALLTWIVYHGKIYWYHGLALIGYYITYVVTVLLSSYNWSAHKEIVTKLTSTQNLLNETSRLLGSQAKPPRLDIPDHGFAPDYEPHLGHIIRPTSPLSSNPTLRIDTSIHGRHQLPRTTSTNGSINTLRPYRRAMTPRVGIRSSFFGGIELRDQISAIRRANSSQQMMGTPSLIVPNSSHYQQQQQQQQQHRRRQVSVPQGFWKQRSSNSTSFNSMQFTRPQVGRPRASTVTDRLAVGVRTNGGLSATIPRPTTPESTNSSTGVAEDYFAYLSTYQPQPMQPPSTTPRLTIPSPQPPQLSVPYHQGGGVNQQGRNAPEMTIPEIRLAPPMIEQYHTPSAVSPSTNDQYHRLASPDQRGSLHVMTPSPSMASTSTDYDCFVSARQSPELTPTVFDHDRPMMGDEEDDQEIEHKLLSAHHIDDNNNSNNNTPWYSQLVEIYQVLFPTLQEWSSKSWLSCLSSLVAMPLVLIFTLTLPVAEAADVKVDEVEVMMIRDDDDDYVYQTGAYYPSTAPPLVHASSFGGESTSYYPPQQQRYSSTTSPHPTSYGSFMDDRLAPPPPESHPKPSPSSYLTVPASESDYFHQQQQHQQQSGITKSLHSTSDILDVIDADLQQGWCRWLLAVQAVLSMTFIFGILVFNEFIEPHQVIIGVGIGATLSLVVLATTRSSEPPSWFWMMSFVGFVISLNWIFLLANAMVGLLQALGKIFDISEAIMGLTVFAFGNSVGDLVSNTAIAKMGFPTMAISACYAGPLLNMVLGVGVSSTFQIWKSQGQPFPLVIPPTILISAGGLLTVLLSTLFVVNMNGFHVNKQLGYWTISVYVFCCITNLLIEFNAFKS
ncbi:Sodium/calcium exchanger protein-domain-containing protein [Chlamydoabsidia padenii]|nr:Sodium/calcium exchanger protein-domain-containing protein [Chlamydoabsidia padenii]